jgi:hypothetical protein
VKIDAHSGPNILFGNKLINTIIDIDSIPKAGIDWFTVKKLKYKTDK